MNRYQTNTHRDRASFYRLKNTLDRGFQGTDKLSKNIYLSPTRLFGVLLNH
ncbi:MAG: hypothetical protein ACLFTJ_01450 [Halothece sp.]